jgi:hypothetical protein
MTRTAEHDRDDLKICMQVVFNTSVTCRELAHGSLVLAGPWPVAPRARVPIEAPSCTSKAFVGVVTRAETSNVAIRHRPAYSSSVTDDSPKDSPTLEALGKAVRATTRYGWLILAGALIVLGALGWLPWATLVWIGLVGAGLIALSPIAFGVVVAIDSRRRQRPP